MKRFLEFYFLATNRVLNEGGAYGRVNHPFDDNDLSFSDIKEMIRDVLKGDLKTVAEKTDGINILVSWKDNRLVAARNKSHLKNNGENALDVKGISNMFAGRGKIKDAFEYAMSDLQNAFSKLPRESLDKLFENGKKFLSLEIIYPDTANVIPYNFSMLISHEVIGYNLEGEPISRDRNAATELFQIINNTNNHIQTHFHIKVPGQVQFKVPEVDNQINQFTQMANDIRGDLDENKTIGDYKLEKWIEILKNKADELKYEIHEDILNKVAKRFALDDKSLKLNDIKKTNIDFFNWVKEFESNELASKQKEIIRPLEVLFLRLGVMLLKNISGLLVSNPSQITSSILGRIHSKIKEIESSNVEASINILKNELKRLDDVGGFDSVLPTEGVVFEFKGKLFKITGSFSPINQILGIGRYK